MLNHSHVFIVLANRYKRDGPNFIWCGNKSNEFERNFATNLVQNQVKGMGKKQQQKEQNARKKINATKKWSSIKK
jgi:hypothetical protein